MFKPFEGQVNYPDMEHRMLRFWAEHAIFEKLRAQLAGKPRWSFIDGPITANNPMGVHHAWGRTYKDIYCRYRAMKGYDQRWQNGFDCQGLWLEVEVEKALGFNSKRDIERFGLDNFSRECRARVERFAERITQQSIRMGQWMQWYDDTGRHASYFTLDDNNIEHIWYFLKVCHDRGWLYRGHRSMPWCWRCGTSLSQHELVDSYREQTDPSCFFRCQIEGRPDEYFLVWTTTPWTLTANTALAIQPEADYAKMRVNGAAYYLMAARVEAVLPKDAAKVATVNGRELVGLRYHGPMEDLPVQAAVTRRTIAWDTVSAEEGTGIVHIAPGCGAEDFLLGQQEGLDVIVPIDENGYFVPQLGWLEGKHVTESADLIHANLQARGVLFEWGDYPHRYPFCWRCKTPLVFRLADEWFLSCEEIRGPMKREAANVRWMPEYGGALMQNWLDNMGDWCISRRRFWGLPLPFYLCACGHLTVVGSTVELRERAVSPDAVDALLELHRPWIDEVTITCEKCGNVVERVPEVGDCWLDAGIVPFSTLNYLPEHKGMTGTKWSIRGSGVRGQGSGGTNNPQSAIRNPQSTWSRWFPADWISEMREQVRLWFYSQLFMSVTLENRTPYQSVLTYEEMRDESGEPFSKSGGNAIAVEDAAEKMGADTMRWLFASAPLNMIFRFGYGPADEVKRKMLTLWNVYSFFVTYANLPDCPPLVPGAPVAGRSDLDRWIVARLNKLVAFCNDRLDTFDSASVVREVEQFVTEDLSTWYVRRSRRRFWKSGDDADKTHAVQTLYEVLVTLAKLIAPLLPFTAEEFYQSLVRTVDPAAPESVHLCAYPAPNPALLDPALLDDMDALMRVVGLGRAARMEAKMKVRQPALRLLVKPGSRHEGQVIERLRAQILDELNVKELVVVEDESALQSFSVKPVFSKWGPKFGRRLSEVQRALAAADANEVGARVAAGQSIVLDVSGEPVTIQPDDLIVERVAATGLAVVADNGCVVAVDTTVTKELQLEGLMRDFVRHVQNLRKEANFHVIDRIEVYYVTEGDVADAIIRHAEYIQAETLAVRLVAGEPPAGATVTEITIGSPVRVGVARVTG